MIPYANGHVLNSAHKYEIEKTQALFDFSLRGKEDFVIDSRSRETHLDWIYTKTPFEKRLLQDTSHVSSTKSIEAPQKRRKSKTKKRRSNHKRRRSDKIKNWIMKMFKKKRKRFGRDENRIQRKYVIPFILGFLAAKTLLIPVALKVLAFLSAKGLMMGFFSTVLASVLSLKRLFENSRGYKERKDDTKTQVEIIQVPSKNEDHIYYDKHYTKEDYVY